MVNATDIEIIFPYNEYFYDYILIYTFNSFAMVINSFIWTIRFRIPDGCCETPRYSYLLPCLNIFYYKYKNKFLHYNPMTG